MVANRATGKTIFAIAGIPGSGKTTLAEALATRFGWPLITTGDLARRVDPGAMETGDLAEEKAFRRAFEYALFEYPIGTKLIIDGMPRSRVQLDYLPAEQSQVILLTCRPDVAADRLRARARPDDTDALITKRLTEQTTLLGLDTEAPWAYAAAGWGAAVNTTYKDAKQVAAGVIDFIAGRRREAF